MSLKENLQKKIKIQRLTDTIDSTMRETAEKKHVNKDAVRELLEMTDFEKTRARDLILYVRPVSGDTKEVLVLDNELPIYRSTVADVAMRKTPHWKEMFSIKNIQKVLNDKDVIVSKGKESLIRVKDSALALLDLSYSREDLERLSRDARISLNKNSLSGIQESFDLFFQLLDFQSITSEILEPHVKLFAGVTETAGEARLYQDVIIFDEKRLEVRLLKGDFSPDSDWDLARLLKVVKGEFPADAEGEGVFEYLVQLVPGKQSEPGNSSSSANS